MSQGKASQGRAVDYEPGATSMVYDLDLVPVADLSELTTFFLG